MVADYKFHAVLGEFIIHKKVTQRKGFLFWLFVFTVLLMSVPALPLAAQEPETDSGSQDSFCNEAYFTLRLTREIGRFLPNERTVLEIEQSDPVFITHHNNKGNNH